MKKSIKILLISLCAFLLVLIILFVSFWNSFGQKFSAALSIKQLEKGLYSLEFIGDYGFDKFLDEGGAATDNALADFLAEYLLGGFYSTQQNSVANTFACSSIVSTNGQLLFGRNFDCTECSTMIVHTKPNNGYESFSTACLDFLGFGEDWLPDKSITDKFMALASIFVPLDGMNEKGLYVADLMAGDQEITNQSTDKPDVTTTTAIRLLLDKASTVDEAIKLLKNVDMNSSYLTAHHLAIADASGKSVVVEYVNNKMLIFETSVVTNHYLAVSEKAGTGAQSSIDRFNMLSEKSKSTKNESDVLDALKSAVQDSNNKTMWSIVYYPALKGADFYFKQNYSNPYSLLLCSDKAWLIN